MSIQAWPVPLEPAWTSSVPLLLNDDWMVEVPAPDLVYVPRLVNEIEPP